MRPVRWIEAIKRLVLWTPFTYHFVGPVALLAYLGVLTKPSRLSAWQAAFAATLGVLVVHHLLASGVGALFQIRYYWGWLLFFYFFRSNPLGENHVRAFRWIWVGLCFYTLAEAIAVNTFIDATILPNYPHDRVAASSHLGGVYQRPYSFGANATITSTLLLTMGLMVPLRMWQKGLLGITIVVVGSATGILLLVGSAIASYRHDRKSLVAGGLVVLLGAAYLLFVPVDYLGRGKITLSYFWLIFQGKLETVVGGSQSIVQILVGAISHRETYGGDFAVHTLFVNFGLLGIALLVAFTMTQLKRITALPVLVLLVGIVHYGALFSVPGQALFGLLLAGGFQAIPPAADGVLAPLHPPPSPARRDLVAPIEQHLRARARIRPRWRGIGRRT